MSLPEVIGEGEKIVTVILLEGDRLNVRIPKTATGKDLFNHVVKHIDLRESKYFGLMIIKESEQQFVNLKDRISKLSKFAPNLWRDDSSRNSSLMFTMFFRVKFYVENICLLKDEITRHLYYLQLRKDVLEGNIYVHEETALLLASYALQAEVRHELGSGGPSSLYFAPEKYLPQRAIMKLTPEQIRHQLPKMHHSHRNLTEAQAEIEFLKEAQKLQEYGVLFHKVSKFKKDRRGGFSLGICLRGILVYEERGFMKTPIFRHPWQHIKRMSFYRRRFFIEAQGTKEIEKMILFTSGYKQSRYLLAISTDFYDFHSVMESSLTESKDKQAVDTPENYVDNSNNGKETRSVDRSQSNGSAFNQLSGNKYQIELIKEKGSFGFNVMGGANEDGIFLKSVKPNGAASRSGKMLVGDKLLEIDGKPVGDKSTQEVVQMLRRKPQSVTLKMQSGEALSLSSIASRNHINISTEQIPLTFRNIEKMKQSEKDAPICLTVELPKLNGSFGMSLTGGPEIGGIFVKTLLPDGAAEQSGSILVGDRVLEINGANLENCTRKHAVQLLRTCSSTVRVIIERYKGLGAQLDQKAKAIETDILKSSPTNIIVELQKQQQSLGLSVVGGLELGGIYVRTINPNGAADLDGRISVGDRILCVNAVSLIGVTRQEAVDVMRSAGKRVRMVIDKCEPSYDAMSDSMTSVQSSQTLDEPVEYGRQTFEVTLYKQESGLGMSLIGGGPREPIFIKSLVPEGTAAKSGALEVGDILIQVNGNNLDRLTYKEALSIIRSCPPEVRLLVQRQQTRILRDNYSEP
ncbi:tyrosine-protein phosphatase non-receptor type 13-like isoform X2 [Xenia sp. Carnegie-2017]|uniref:tyrosine-protein phosphatase non-receptor type 13-like isoform X2 n=1 Tax=Xenia sp. Carnegie-2017 TaxID=2897299 RepID=UPI001F041365|nr:tyrosine-protein phosphatase non-receptor type 13-like isoform X2 [Xenia sp. Carnegie-2017]